MWSFIKMSIQDIHGVAMYESLVKLVTASKKSLFIQYSE